MKNYRKIRIALALLSFIALNSAFLDVTEWGAPHCSWLAQWQIMPALLSLNLGILAVWLAVTIICGRHYCSLMCPLGIYQDIVAHFAHCPKKRPYRPTVAWRRTRLISLVVFTALTVCGFLNIACLIEPYGTYGRIASELFAPIYSWGNNQLANLAASRGSFAVGAVPLRPHSAIVLSLALFSWIAITLMAWKSGRLFCNTLCPVGTLLGLVNKVSICQVRIDTDKCQSCHLCEKVCKCGCIDIATKSVDNSRCVVCGRCWQTCKFEGIKYGKR